MVEKCDGGRNGFFARYRRHPSGVFAAGRTRVVIRVDAHQHYWSLRRGDYAWLKPSEVKLFRDFTPEDLSDQLAECAVRATVVVQSAATEAETHYLFDLANSHPSIAGVVGWVDFEASDVADRVRRLIREGGGKLKGLRPMVQDISDPSWLERSSLDAAFGAMLEHDLAFDALVTPSHLQVLERRLRRHPALRAVLDHAGKPDIAGGAFEPWARQVEQLAGSTAMYCKLSGLLTQADLGAGIAELDAFVERIFHCFGADRVMWGSDWPVVTTRAPYGEWLDTALALVKRHAPGHEQDVFAKNAVRFYRLDLEECIRGDAECQ
jgi:L-fuconolactonase